MPLGTTLVPSAFDAIVELLPVATVWTVEEADISPASVTVVSVLTGTVASVEPETVEPAS